MPLTNSLKTKLDLPVFEWLRFAPTATAATSAMCFGDTLTERYMYYVTGVNFYRYDTISDSWQTLASIPTCVTTVALKYTSFGGYRGNILSAGAANAVIPGLKGTPLVGYKIRIMSGTGQGQERTINACADAKVYDHGIASSIGAGVSIVDNLKKWLPNQWVGYQVRVVLGTGFTQVRKVLYNDATTLYFQDPNYQQLEPFNNTWFATAPAAGSHYYIEASTITVDSSWTVQPDVTSSFCILSGGVWAITATAVAPFAAYYYYDILTDTWNNKTSPGGHLYAALATDWSLERTGEVGGYYEADTTASSGAARSITCSGKTYTADIYSNYQIRIISGTGVGQRRRIIGNTADTFYVDRPWDTNPDSTSHFAVLGNVDNMYLVGNGGGTMYKYSVEIDYWATGECSDFGTAGNMSCKFAGQEMFTLTSATKNAAGILTVAVNAPGTNYVVGDILTLSTTGTGAKVRVAAVTTSGAVSAVTLYASGTGYTSVTSSATTGGAGSGCTITTTVGAVARVVTVQNHNLCVGDSVTIAGVADSYYNGAFTIIGVDGIAGFDIAISASAAASASASLSNSTTLLVDASKNWTAHELIGKILHIAVAGVSPTIQSRRITENTATSITVATLTAQAVNGTSRYTIQEPFAFGRDEQWKEAGFTNNGYATGGSGTTLIDSTKTWYLNQWAGYRIRIVSGTGFGSEFAITSNTSTTLTYSSQGFTPDATTKYLIMDTFGIATTLTNSTNAVVTDTTKGWPVNIWAGQKLRITAGAGIGQEIVITSNTATAITCTGVFATAPDTTSMYTILGLPNRGAGTNISWLFGGSIAVNKGRYMLSSRGGGSNAIDRFDITTGVWDYTIFIIPQTETMNTGTMYTYDGGDWVYFTNATTSSSKIFRINVNTWKVEPCTAAPYGHNTAVIGNRMEIVQTDDGLQFLYIMRHTGQEMWRVLIFW